jgi:hypothetical protein
LNKQSLYVAVINTTIGVGASLLFKDNLAIAWVLMGLVLITIIYIERAWLFANVFRNRLWIAVAAATLLAILFLSGLVVTTEPQRKTSAVVRTISLFLGDLKANNQHAAYNLLSRASREAYLRADFIGDHSGIHRLKDFTIEQVVLNRYDGNKAQVQVSSPFRIFGHGTTNLELVREMGEWRVVLDRKEVMAERLAPVPVPEPAPATAAKRPVSKKGAKRAASEEPKKKSGAVTTFFKKIF